jgi:hypothetical protein
MLRGHSLFEGLFYALTSNINGLLILTLLSKNPPTKLLLVLIFGTVQETTRIILFHRLLCKNTSFSMHNSRWFVEWSEQRNILG